MPDFELLKTYTDRLSKLLEDPQPGHVSWCQMVAEAWEKIAKMWSEPK